MVDFVYLHKTRDFLKNTIGAIYKLRMNSTVQSNRLNHTVKLIDLAEIVNAGATA